MHEWRAEIALAGIALAEPLMYILIAAVIAVAGLSGYTDWGHAI